MEEKRGWYFTMATLFIRSGWGWGWDGVEGQGRVGRWGLEPRGEMAEPIAMARALQVPLPATSLGRTRGNPGTTGRVLISHIPFLGTG